MAAVNIQFRQFRASAYYRAQYMISDSNLMDTFQQLYVEVERFYTSTYNCWVGSLSYVYYQLLYSQI